MNNKVEPTRPFYLRNHNNKDWNEPLAKTEATETDFKEHELIDMIVSGIKRKTFVVIRGTLGSPRSRQASRVYLFLNQSPVHFAVPVDRHT